METDYLRRTLKKEFKSALWINLKPMNFL